MKQRKYQEVAKELEAMIRNKSLVVGNKLMPERKLAGELNVTRAVLREALIKLELEGVVEVRQGSGIYILDRAAGPALQHDRDDDIGPFELLQARQILESEIARFAAKMASKKDIQGLREAIEMDRQTLDAGGLDYPGDELFHSRLAEATQNSALVDTVEALWQKRKASPMWFTLHKRVKDSDHRLQWIQDHEGIVAALVRRSPTEAHAAMSRHMENVSNRLLCLSDVDDPFFDGYMFQLSDNASDQAQEPQKSEVRS